MAQPDRELAFVVLGQNTNEALEEPKPARWNHNRPLGVGVNVLVGAVGQLEVKLSGTPPQRRGSRSMEVNLLDRRTHCRLVDHVIDAPIDLRIAQAPARSARS